MQNNNDENVKEALPVPVDSCWSRTKVDKEVKFGFAWTFEKFSDRPEETGKCVSSRTLIMKGPDDMETKWKINVYPKGCSQRSDNYVSVYLSYESEAVVKTKYEISILGAAQKRYSKVSEEKTFTSKSSYGISEFISHHVLKSQAALLLLNNSLTIHCDLTIYGSKILEEEVKMEKVSLQNLQEDFELAFSHKEFSDIKIHCGEKVFDCHQVILAARSPVFRAMFQAEMTEKKTKKVDIPDLHPDVLSEMLTFIYTGKSPSVDNLAQALLAAADKYQVELLKIICVEKLCKSIDVKNCVDYLVMGDRHQADVLKKFSLEFIAKNVASVCQTGEWKESLVDHPALMVDVIEAFGRKERGVKVIKGSS